MKEQLISVKTLYLAYEKGLFATPLTDEKIEIITPTQSLLQKWLREKHKINIDIRTEYKRQTYYHIDVVVKSVNDFGAETKSIFEEFNFKTYEEALEKGLQESLKLIK